MSFFQKHSDNSRNSEKDKQDVRLRPDEKVEAGTDPRLRGANIKLSTRGPKKQHHRKHKRKSRRG